MPELQTVWAMRKPPFHLGLMGAVLVLVVLAGCRPQPPVTATYDAGDGITAYETDDVPLSSVEWGSSLGGEASVGVQAQAWCPGRGCTPRNVSLVFEVAGGSETLMSDRSVELSADGKTLYNGAERGGELDNQKVPAVGVIAIAEVSYDQFQTLATADEVDGHIGNVSFSMDHDDRSPFRALVQRVGGPSGGS